MCRWSGLRLGKGEQFVVLQLAPVGWIVREPHDRIGCLEHERPRARVGRRLLLVHDDHTHTGLHDSHGGTTPADRLSRLWFAPASTVSALHDDSLLPDATR